MPTRTTASHAAMVNDADQALAEGGPELVGGLNELRHVLGIIFVARERAVESVDHDGSGFTAAELFADRPDQFAVISDQIERHVEQIERHGLAMVREMPTTPRFDARRKTVPAFEREINHRSLLHLAPPILPSEGDVHAEIECPKALATLWRSPNHRETYIR